MAFDFRGVWNRQNITHATELQMSEIAQKVYEYLTDPRREVQNVTEWAKREACWKGVKALPVALRDDFVAELVPVSALKEAEKMAREIQKQPAKDLSSIKIRKELNRPERKEGARNQAHHSGRSESMSFPRLHSRQNRLVDLVVPHDRKNNGRHFLGHVANDVHIALSLCGFLFVVGPEHRVVLYRNGASHPDGPA